MEVLNKTSFIIAPMASQIAPPQDSITVVVKGTFEIAPDGSLKALDTNDQEQLAGDEPFMDDIGRSLSYASDLDPYKVKADLLVKADCHQPEGRAAEECNVSITIGAWRKSLKVIGDRRWISNGGETFSMSEPEPFVSLPLRWENAFGGLDHPYNPMGKGMDDLEDDNGVTFRPLPNIEDPAALIEKWDDAPNPSGMAAIAADWATRAKKFGTRDRRWATFVAPLPPKDFDPTFYNAAPEDQQFPGGFRGDEQIVLENMHPTQSTFTLKMPELRIRAFLTTGGEDFDELPLALDTVQIDMVEHKAYLVWRGGVSVADADNPEQEFICVAQEQLADTPISRETYQTTFRPELEDLIPPHPASKAETHAEEGLAKLKEMISASDLPEAEKASLLQAESPNALMESLLGQLDSNVGKLKGLMNLK